MLFNSKEYLFLFLPVVLLVFQLLSRSSTRERQFGWLVLASLFFYASWQPIYLLLILSSVLVNFWVGTKLSGSSEVARRPWLLAGVAFNLLLLGYYKYTGFLVDSLNSLGDWLIPVPQITLPLAISFFTFQQIAYLVDVSRGNCEEYQLRHYSLFVLFFPQLIAGPIVHHREMMPQFLNPKADASVSTDFAVGLTFICIGLFKKVMIADSLALVADPVFNAAEAGHALNSVDAWLATFAFSFQIYFDFSGYSDIAIGSARLFGIRLPENFSSPYKSTSIIEIWRRWHMTLSRFLRDYLYFSLGGNRDGVVKRYRNLLLTMLLGGLWHGAAWTFVVWGALHGTYLCINHGWRALVNRLGLQGVFGMPIFRPIFLILTFLAWSIAMIVFRAVDLASAWSIIDAAFLSLSFDTPLMLGNAFAGDALWHLLLRMGLPATPYLETCTVMMVAAGVCWLLPSTQQFLADFDPVVTPDGSRIMPGRIIWRPRLLYAAAMAVMLSVSVLSLSTYSRFIYFQF